MDLMWKKGAEEKQNQRQNQLSPKKSWKNAKEIKGTNPEKFNNFLDFTVMNFRDKRRHKIDSPVIGKWLLTSKVEKDGQFKMFNSRWVCRSFQDAQNYDLQMQIHNPTATRYGFRVAFQQAASMCWDFIHVRTIYITDALSMFSCLLTLACLPIWWVKHSFRLWTCRRTKEMVEPLRHFFKFYLAFNEQKRIGAHRCAMMVLVKK